MISIQEFIDVYNSNELLKVHSTDEYYILSYTNSAIQYTVYNDKLKIHRVTINDKKFSYQTLTYDACMDWVVMFRRGIDGIHDERVHYKHVSNGLGIITPELFNKILLLKEIVVYDHNLLMIECGMKNGKI